MRFYLIMVMMTSFLIQVHADGLAQKIVWKKDNVSLKELFSEIRKQTGYTVVYQSNQIKPIKRLNVDFQNTTLEAALSMVFADLPLTYVVKDQAIVIKAKEETFSGVPSKLMLQNIVVTGKVTNATGYPLVGVSVLVKGAAGGVTTGNDGSYRITVPGTGAVLVFSYVGYHRREIEVGNQSVIHVSLIENQESLTEVVVTALGIERSERSLGYASQAIKGENLTVTKDMNVINTLAGKIAGVQVVGASGASMGGTSKIKIRGVNSLTGGGEPLMVVDGTPISNANFAGRNGGDYGNIGQDVNPEDIESINVLKGPAASALYGIRGQYGVIMITTRKGSKKAQKADVSLNSAFSVERVGNFMPLQNLYGGGGSQTWRTLPNGDKYVDMLYDESWGPKMDGTMVRDVFSFYPQDPTYGQLTPFVPHPNNIKDFFETGTNLNTGVSVAGGGENSTFRISFNDTRIGGVEPNSNLKRNNVGVNGSLDISKKLTVSGNVNYATNNGQRPAQGYDGGSRYLVQWFQRNVDMNRLKDYKYSDGTFVNWNLRRPNATTGEITDFSPLYWNNPYFEAYENLNNDNRDRFFGNVGLAYKPFEGLTLSGFLRGDMYTQNIETREAFGGRYVPEYTVGKYQNREMNYEFLGTYDKRIGDFSVNANLGANIYTRRYNYLYMSTAGGLTTPGYYNINASVDRPNTTSYLLRKEIRSLYAMASLGYRDMVYLDGSIRNDNSSALPTDNNSYWYPSVSGSFIVSELLDFDPSTFAKLRASYAMAGSDLSPYRVVQTYAVGGIYNNINTILERDALANPNIKPSFANSYELGADLKFFNGRLGLDLTYYFQRNKNEIFELEVPGTSGYSSTIVNAGVIENKGVEVTLSAVPVQTQNFTWSTNFNISRNRNKVVELATGIDVLTLESNTYSGVTAYLQSFVGQPFGSLIGKAYQRDEATGKVLLNGALNADGSKAAAYGRPLYTEANHNFGSVLPDFTGGFQNTFRLFNTVDVGAMIDFQFGGQFFSWSQMLAVKTGMAELTAATNDRGMNVRDPVSEGGGVKVNGILATTGEEVTEYIDAYGYFRTTLGTHVYEEWLYDASFIKLRELRLGYSLNSKLLQGTPFRSVNLAVIARNPLQIWQKAPKGIDPAELSVGANNISWLETGNLNTVRSFGLNLNVTF